MKNNLVSLPSGTVLNLDLVAFVAVLPGAADRRKKMRVVFGFAGPGGSASNMQLDEEDSNALIIWFCRIAQGGMKRTASPTNART